MYCNKCTNRNVRTAKWPTRNKWFALAVAVLVVMVVVNVRHGRPEVVSHWTGRTRPAEKNEKKNARPRNKNEKRFHVQFD